MTRLKIFCLGLAALAFVAKLSAYDVEQVFRPERLVPGDVNLRPVQDIDRASWVWSREDAVPAFRRFRRSFSAIEGEPLEIDVSADERYVLLLDGKEISRGPHRGLKNLWHFQSYRISGLEPGDHVLEAVCWRMGEGAPHAQVSIRGGFVLKASGRYDERLTTGRAVWEVATLAGTRMTDRGDSGAFGTGAQCEVRGTALPEERPADGDYEPATVVRGPVRDNYGLVTSGWVLYPTILRDMMMRPSVPGRIVRGPDVLAAGCVIPPHSSVSALWDLGNYFCAYPELRTDGGRGAFVSWGWAEALVDAEDRKADRAAHEGLEFRHGFSDAFYPDGRAEALFTTPWWRCGRWCRIQITTTDEPLAIRDVRLVETRYPASCEASFSCDDELVMRLQPLCVRSLQMCLHEMFFDCPFYEQQMYPGDSRLQFLVAGLFDREDRAVRNAMTLYDFGRRPDGMFPMNVPSRGGQSGFGFTECALFMFRDYLMNHGNRRWLEVRLPGMNHALMGCEAFARADGLLCGTPGWNFVDWVRLPSWNSRVANPGVPPSCAGTEPNAEINLQYLYALQSAVACEETVGHVHLAAHWRDRAERLKAAIRRTFWCPDRALFASSAARRDFSEHAQCLALLCDVVTGEEAQACFRALVDAPDLARCTIYYRHYLFETFFKFRRSDLFFSKLDFWRKCLDLNLSTVMETPEADSRSDCHGWGSHVLWHLHTGVAGVRSAAPFYEKVLVEPQPAHLRAVRTRTPTPKGDVCLNLTFSDSSVRGAVVLPPDLSGTFRWQGADHALGPGSNVIGR